MHSAAADRTDPGPRSRRGPWDGLRTLVVGAALGCSAWIVPAQQQAQPPAVEVVALGATRSADAIAVDYQLRVTLPPAVEDAARRGVPLYFVATATLWKPRWYWRDDRIGRVRREWRLSFQPLTSTWRVSQGGLGQSHDNLADALATMTRSGAWRVADVAQADADGRHYVEFVWALDTTQLPRPLQIGVTGVGGGSDWALSVERIVKLDAAASATSAPAANGSAQTETK